MANPKKIKAEIKKIESYGQQVYKIVFKTEKKMPKFKAGQFLHLTLDNFDPTTGFWPESRVFSIASCSDDRKEVTIVYSVKGVYTKKMENTMSEGSSVWLKAPYGAFIIPNYIIGSEEVVLIAGGTGVSPFIPFLKQVNSSIKVQLHYGIRNKDLVLFEDALKTALEMDNFLLALYLEELSYNAGFSGNVSIKEGQLSVERILEAVQNKNNALFFISGPPAMIELFKQQLAGSGISKEKIIIDEWG